MNPCSKCDICGDLYEDEYLRVMLLVGERKVVVCDLCKDANEERLT